LISAEQFSRELDKIDTGEVHLTIRLDGDHARRYVELIKSPEISATFKKNGNLLLSGVAIFVDESRFRVRHIAIVRVVGQPLEILSMESEIGSALIAGNRAALAAQRKASQELVLHLNDVHTITIQVKKLVGGFPDSARYD
jgi:hypothetical protein